MNGLVVYDSVFGNTEKIARAIGAALALQGTVETLPVSQVELEKGCQFDFLVLGSPTRGFRPTEAVSAFLNMLSRENINGIGVAAFDTRIDLNTIDSSVFRFIVDKGGYAASTIAQALKKKGGKLLAVPEGFFVTGEQGPLKAGELERAGMWARDLLAR